MHAVDAAGVHPLLLAIGSERYAPYEEQRQPRELLTQANAILGQGQLSLAKYLLIAAEQDAPRLDVHDIDAFLRHVLERIDWRRDLHFQTETTIDTLDYSGAALNAGQRLSWPPPVPLVASYRMNFRMICSCRKVSHCRKSRSLGVLAIEGPKCSVRRGEADAFLEAFCRCFTADDDINRFPLIVIVDDSEFVARSLNNFLWTVFTRSNPAVDLYGIDAFTHCKHWGCKGALVIDARLKPHHAPPLIDDPQIEKRVDELGAPGGPLHGII